MNESTLTQAPVTLETKAENKSKVLRGPVLPTNRVKNFVSTRIIAPVVIGLATIGSPSESQGADRKDVAIAALVGLGVGAVAMHQYDKQTMGNTIERRQQGIEVVRINPQTKAKLQELGFSFGPGDQYIDNNRGQKLIFKNPGRDDKFVNVTALGPYQLLLKYGYMENGKKYEQSVFCTISKEQGTFNVTGKTEPQQVAQ